MYKNIVLITDSKGRIPQKKHETESLDLYILKGELEKNGYKVLIKSYYDIVNKFEIHKIKNQFFFYASSQYTRNKDYIDDCLLYIKNNDGKLIPGYALVMAHENKVFQELEKKRLHINTPNSIVFDTLEDGMSLIDTMEFPFIAKVSKGFSSRGVEKIKSKKEATKFIKKNMFALDGNSYVEKLFHLYRKIKFRGKYPKKTGKIVFQDMIKSLEYDWKILVFFDKFYVLKRFTKKNDFRASGSGIFDFSADVPKEVLKFANETREILNSPVLSLDIAEKGGKCYLIEYQAVHFGLVTAIENKHFYHYTSSNDFIKKTKQVSVEKDFAYAINMFIINNYV